MPWRSSGTRNEGGMRRTPALLRAGGRTGASRKRPHTMRSYRGRTMEKPSGFAPGVRSPPAFVLVVLNPASGRGAGGRMRPRIEAALQRTGVRYRLVATTGAGHAGDLAREAAQNGADRLLVAGGDGTLHDAVQAHTPGWPPLGVLPTGTGNDVARALRIPLSVERALDVALHGAPRRLDLARCNGRRFINVAGCGFDAAVADRVNRRCRWLSGTAAYIAAMASVLMTYRASRMLVQVDDATAFEGPAMLVAVANSGCYGGGMRIAPDARTDDGLLDVCIVRSVGRLRFALAFPRVYRGTHTTHPGVRMLRGARVRIESDGSPLMLIDGEVWGSVPAVFGVEPLAVTFMTPAVGGESA
ncbi:MAG TPA: diacylglycerol kinase family protein [Chthonomonadales bacterium]|nr:diacylglycerol kinase family protein [Chthonomonadales bacterium]